MCVMEYRVVLLHTIYVHCSHLVVAGLLLTASSLSSLESLVFSSRNDQILPFLPGLSTSPPLSLLSMLSSH